MRDLMLFDPFDDIMSLHHAINRFFEESFAHPGFWFFNGTTAPAMKVDIYERDDGYEIRALVPGLKPEDIELTTDERTLTIKGRVPRWLSDDEAKRVRWHIREIGSGEFVRSITLPRSFQADKISASMEDGVMHIWVPLTPEALRRRIPIQAGKATRLLPGQTVEADQPRGRS
jgi:HSP20 family protein